MLKEWKGICFDSEHKTCMILDERKQSYDYRKLRKCTIASEEAKQKGVTKPFLHTIPIGPLQYSAILSGKVYVGLIFDIADSDKMYAYISETPVLINSLQYYKDLEIAKEISRYCDKIIAKYQKEK